MHLAELIRTHSYQPNGVPDWLLGYFRRTSITFANGMSDRTTNVRWLQCRNITIDLRLPRREDLVQPKPWSDYSVEELRQLANYEGWCADAVFDDRQLSWSGGVSLQLHNRWSEPAELRRVGNCMIEFAPSGAYVEDWRQQPSKPGPLVGLRLLEERDLRTGAVRHRGGALCVCGDYAGLVLGRAAVSSPLNQPNQLRELAVTAQGSARRLRELFGCEVALASGSLTDGYRVEHSTRLDWVSQPLIDLEGFETPAADGLIRQCCASDGVPIERFFAIDSLEPHLDFSHATAASSVATRWFQEEGETLRRYLEGVH